MPLLTPPDADSRSRAASSCFLCECSLRPLGRDLRLIAHARVRSVWYFAGGRRHYKGPQSNRADAHGDTEVGALPSAEKAGAAGVV